MSCEPAGAGAGPMVPVMHRVVGRREDLEGTVTLFLSPLDAPPMAPAPGQFNMLWVFGVGEAPISVAGSEGGVLAHTVRRVGAVTAGLCASVEGDLVGVRGPFGTGWDLQRAAGRDVLFVAGGLGLVPLRPLVSELVADRAAFGRAVLLLGARSPDQLLYGDELRTWRDTLDVEVTVDAATLSWRGHVGVVTKLIARAPVEPARTTAFVCGPEVMMRVVAAAVIDRGVPSAEVSVSLERNMHCAIGHCGHCQLGPAFICKDGPVMEWSRVEPLLRVRAR